MAVVIVGLSVLIPSIIIMMIIENKKKLSIDKKKTVLYTIGNKVYRR